MLLINEEKIERALKILEETYPKQLKKLRGEEHHPFLEQVLNQMALLYKITR
jgi:hypothetical protein